MMRPAMTLALALAATPLFAQEWFQHRFGELRAYHGDWLVVCAEDGAGPCRAVQSAPDPGSDAIFDTRAALHRIDGTPDWVLEIMDRGMDSAALTAVRIVIDGERIDIPPGGWRIGELTVENVAETIVISDAAINADLVARMRAGNRMQVQYDPPGTGDGLAAYSLRGITAATNAINARVLARQE